MPISHYSFSTVFLLLMFASNAILAQIDHETKKPSNPIEVTHPSKAVYANRVIEVAWAVDQSAADATVNIALVSKSGTSEIETTLASETANDGQELVSIPYGVNANLRIRISTSDDARVGVNPCEFKIESDGRTVVIVRHAEKRSGSNPSLTEDGDRRAHKLAAILKPLGITHVFSTKYKRTQETAEPTASNGKIEVQNYSNLKQLKQWIDKTPEDAKILIVGHSNTVGPTSELLGGESFEIKESEYANLVVLDYQTEKSDFALLKFAPDRQASDPRDSPDGQAQDAGEINK